MIILSLTVLVLVVVALLVGVHLGPHSSVAGSTVALILSAGLLVYVLGHSELASVMVAWIVVSATLVASAAVLIWGLFGIRSYRNMPKPSRRLSRLLDGEAYAITDIDQTGSVKVAGETWTAVSSSGHIPKGTRVFVTEVDRLRLTVIPVPKDLSEPEAPHTTNYVDIVDANSNPDQR